MRPEEAEEMDGGEVYDILTRHNFPMGHRGSPFAAAALLEMERKLRVLQAEYNQLCEATTWHTGMDVDDLLNLYQENMGSFEY